MSDQGLDYFECVAVDAVRRKLEELLAGATSKKETQALSECVALLSNLPMVARKVSTVAANLDCMSNDPEPHPTAAVVCPTVCHAVDIDVELVELIKLLWACGIETAHSCQGSSEQPIQLGYIMLIGGDSIDSFLMALNLCRDTKLFVCWPDLHGDWGVLLRRRAHSVADLIQETLYALRFQCRASVHNPQPGDKFGLECTIRFHNGAIAELVRVFTGYAALVTRHRAIGPTLRKRKF